MRRSIDLDGEWQRRDFLDEAWRWSDALAPTAPAAAVDGPPVQAGVSAGWRPGRVPGSTIDDAWRGGEVPNPYVDRGSLAAEWVPQRTWLYRRSFTVPDVPFARAALRFDGIDPGGTVLLDGEELALHARMFVPLEIDLGDRLRGGERHDLVVAVSSAPPMPSQVGRTELARHHRSRMGYGWDFCPRILHTGIWGSVRLELRARAWLSSPTVRVTPAADGSTATLHLRCAVAGDAGGTVVHAGVIDPGGAKVARRSASVRDGGVVVISLDVPRPRLWWPNGSGDADRYRLELCLEGDGTTLDQRGVGFGVRSFELHPTDDGPPDALAYTAVVNGRPTWIRGWNWVPADALFGVPRPERIRHLIELARRANVNLLRVWGGGLIETETFYDACDAAGIMVLQEFAQSSSGVSNAPAGDDAFVDLMRREAEAIVPLRSHHPSLVAWCGGNELTGDDGRPLTDAHPVLGALHEVVGRLDPDRAWLPTSPSGPRFGNTLAAVADDPRSLHDVHGPWEHQGLAAQHDLADATTSLLHSEFGTEGMTNLPAFEATVSPRHRLPPDRSNPVMAHRGAWWNNEPFVQAVFGGGLTIDELERASQYLQADGLRTLLEGDRRRWPRNAGALPWQLNEPFPNAWCTSAVDYFGVPKAAYHAVAAAYAAVLPGVSFSSQALDGAASMRVTPWVVNDTDAPLAGPLELFLHDVCGRTLDRREVPMAVGPNAVATAQPLELHVPAGAADVLVLDARVAGHAARRLLSRTATLEPMRRVSGATVEASMREQGARWTVEIDVAGSTAAIDLRLRDARPVGWPERTGAAYIGDNHLTLLPGERRSVEVDWRDVEPGARRLVLSGWNVPERVLAGG